MAHINIARRVFDSRTPGFQQLGTVWLPLPHVLMMPFLVSNWMWRTGVGGSLVSMAGYVFGGLGIARLFWKGSVSRGHNPRNLRLGGWLAATFYVLNPNSIYLQTTAMTEPLSMALAIWAIVFYSEFQQGRALAATGEAVASGKATGSLQGCALALAAGMLTRYDTWFLAGVIAVLAFLDIRKSRAERKGEENTALRRAFKHFLALVALAPLLWLAYNFGTYGNALEFATGPYSARAIAQRSAQSGMTHPGYHDLHVAVIYFFKCAKSNLCNGRMVAVALLAAVIGTLMLVLWQRKALAVLLWSPAAFYALSIAYAGVPIFMPVWWPFSYYNVRYGLQLLPVFAVSAGITGMVMGRLPVFARAALALWVVLLAAVYISAWRQTPITLQEARVNAVARVALETRLADVMKELPENSSLLMYTGDHVGALQQAGLPLRRVITENNYHLWQHALEQPARSAEYVIAMNGDPVWQAIQGHGEQLQVVSSFYVPGQPAATVYKSTASFR